MRHGKMNEHEANLLVMDKGFCRSDDSFRVAHMKVRSSRIARICMSQPEPGIAERRERVLNCRSPRRHVGVEIRRRELVGIPEAGIQRFSKQTAIRIRPSRNSRSPSGTMRLRENALL